MMEGLLFIGKSPAATLVAVPTAPPLVPLSGCPRPDPTLHAQPCRLPRGFHQHAPDEDGKRDQVT